MKQHIAILLSVAIFASPLSAEDTPPQATDGHRDLGQMFGDVMGLIDPYLGQLMQMLGDISGWHAPEFLPNGDILIRRRQVEPPAEPEVDEDSEEPVVDPLEL